MLRSPMNAACAYTILCAYRLCAPITQTLFPHFEDGPSLGLDSMPSHEYGCELTQFLSLPCEAQHASRKCIENAIDSRFQNQQLLLIT